MSCTQSRAWAPEKTEMVFRPGRAPPGPGTDPRWGVAIAYPVGVSQVVKLCQGLAFLQLTLPKLLQHLLVQEKVRVAVTGLQAPPVCPSGDSS